MSAAFCDLAGFLVDEQHSQYSKLLLASKEQVLHRVVQEEKVALEQQLAEEKHSPESCFIEAAIQELKVRWCSGVTLGEWPKLLCSGLC